MYNIVMLNDYNSDICPLSSVEIGSFKTPCTGVISTVYGESSSYFALFTYVVLNFHLIFSLSRFILPLILFDIQ